MARFHVMSTLPLITLLDDISVGAVVPRCARRCIYAVEALVHIHHLAMGSGDEISRERASDDVHLPAGPYSHFVPAPRIHTSVSAVPPSVRPVRPVVAHSRPAISLQVVRRETPGT